MEQDLRPTAEAECSLAPACGPGAIGRSVVRGRRSATSLSSSGATVESRDKLEFTAPGTRAPAPERRAASAKDVAGLDELTDNFGHFTVVEAEEDPGALGAQSPSWC